jgi:hypothetical protein
MCNLNGIKRIVPAAVIFFMLLFLAVNGTLFVRFVKANMYWAGGDTSPPPGARPPVITVQSPENETYAADNVSLSFDVEVSDPSSISASYISDVSVWVSEVYYETDWNQDNVSVYNNTSFFNLLSSFVFSGNLTDIPGGNHCVVVHATETGLYVGGSVPGSNDLYRYQYQFYMGSQFAINFTVDTSSPRISVLSIQNKTYDTTDVPLKFTVNEQASWMGYSLNGQDNVTIIGNTTLTELTEGEHSLTVYATDYAGNVGATETVTFTVAKPEPFPTATVVASAATVAAISAALLVYFKKRRH